jgi:class 3 adenylate cyclase
MEPGPSGRPERRIVSVLFADLVGFTSLAERLDPEDLATVQDAYFGAVRDAIARYRGRVEKFIGDAAMAAFGVPRTEDDDAVRAVSAGFALLHAVADLGPRLGLETDDLRLRVGVNTGEVVVAVGGPDEGRLSGDVVNVAARLQAAAAPGSMLLGEVTALAVAGTVELDAAEPLALKGKTGMVRAARAVAMRSEPSRELAMGRLRAGLLGRGHELGRLERAAGTASAGASTRVLISAPPGVGKTRLVEGFAAALELDRGWSVLRVRVRSEPGPALDPVARLVETALAADSGAESPVRLAAPAEWMARLETALAASGRSPGRVATVAEHVGQLLDALDARTRADRATLFASWLDALDALARGRTQAWIVEDLHWAGLDVLAFLDAAGSAPAPAGRLIVATGRPSVLEADVLREPGWERIDLGTLDPDAAGALVEELTGGALPERLVTRIVAASDGNCLFIEELLRAWIGAGVLVEAGAGGLALTVDPDAIELPPSVQAVYAAQLDDLPGLARQAARRGSIAGRRFADDLLPVLGVDGAPDALATLRRRGFVAGPYPSPPIGDEHVFRHALLRDAGYASLGRAERAELHVRAARWLERIGGDRAPELAAIIGEHYADAVDAAPALAVSVAEGLDRAAATELAAAWLERAGDHGLARGAPVAAAGLFSRAIDRTAPEAHLDLARRWRRVGEAVHGALDLAEAAAAFTTATEQARAALGDPGASGERIAGGRRELALAAAGLARARFEQLRFAESLDIAEAALAAVGTGRPEAIPLRLARLRGIEGVSNDYAAVYEESGPVLEAARAFGDPRLVFDATRVHLGFATNLGLGTAGEWQALASDARALGLWTEAGSALTTAAWSTVEADPPAARRLLDEAATLADARGLNEELAWIGLARTSIALRDGEWDTGVAAALAGLDIADRFGYDRAAVRTWSALTPMAEARGDRPTLVRAATWFEAHRASFPHSPYGAVLHAAVDARLAAAGLGAPAELDDPTLLRGVALDDDSPEWLAAIERVVAAAIEAGRPEIGRGIVERFPEAHPGDGHSPLLAASRSLVRAMLAVEGPLSGSAAAEARDAADLARAAAAPWWVARALRLLERAGAAPAGAAAEATALERGMGIRPSARG